VRQTFCEVLLHSLQEGELGNCCVPAISADPILLVKRDLHTEIPTLQAVRRMA
jgi:hypothetical protein